MKLIWTKNNKPLSLLIRWGLKEKCSHFATVFDESLVLHSGMQGVHLRWFKKYRKEVDIVYQIDFEGWSLEEEEKVYRQFMDNFEGEGYDWRALLFFIWRGVLKRFFGKEFPRTNRWQRGDDFLCTKIARILPKELVGSIDLEMTSPEKLYFVINKRKDSLKGAV